VTGTPWSVVCSIEAASAPSVPRVRRELVGLANSSAGRVGRPLLWGTHARQARRRHSCRLCARRDPGFWLWWSRGSHGTFAPRCRPSAFADVVLPKPAFGRTSRRDSRAHFEFARMITSDAQIDASNVGSQPGGRSSTYSSSRRPRAIRLPCLDMQQVLPTVAKACRHLFSLAASATVLGALGFAGCDDSPDVDDGECCLADPQCPAGAREVEACLTDECFTVQACCSEKVCEPEESCALSCDASEIEVPSCDGAPFGCRSVELCGATLFCQTPDFCTAVPNCDDGDVEQPSGSCPDDAVCYQVDQCGSTVLCSDNGLPHGCPEMPPVVGEPCMQVVSCAYPVKGSDCVETWNCTDSSMLRPPPIPCGGGFSWQLVGNSCDRGGGGAGGGGGAVGSGG